MNRICKSALFASLLLALAAGTLAACGGEDHSGHDHAPGETHDDHK